MLRTFAASAATAVALAQSVQADRLRSSLAAADAERRRWARELHDETLQGLGGLRVLLSSALRRGRARSARRTAMREAVEHIEREIENLRAIITELRPAALDELGLRTAIEALLDRHREQSGFEVESRARAAGPDGGRGRLDGRPGDGRLPPRAGGADERRQARRADRVRVAVVGADGELLIEVQDDGGGFDRRARHRRLRAGRHAGARGPRRRHARDRVRRAGDA